jgi:hypothetical protein
MKRDRITYLIGTTLLLAIVPIGLVATVIFFAVFPALATIAGLAIVGMTIITLVLTPFGILAILWEEWHKPPHRRNPPPFVQIPPRPPIAPSTTTPVIDVMTG